MFKELFTESKKPIGEFDDSDLMKIADAVMKKVFPKSAYHWRIDAKNELSTNKAGEEFLFGIGIFGSMYKQGVVEVSYYVYTMDDEPLTKVYKKYSRGDISDVSFDEFVAEVAKDAKQFKAELKKLQSRSRLDEIPGYNTFM